MYDSTTCVAAFSAISSDEACHIFNISASTWRRWRRGHQQPHPTAAALLEIYGGKMPYKGFEGFEVINGELFAPGIADGIKPDFIKSLHYTQQRLKILERENAAPAQYFLDF